MIRAKKKVFLGVTGAAVVALGAIGFALFAIRTNAAPTQNDPRQEPPLVRLALAERVMAAERSFTGTVAARVESNLGFRVPGKIVERLVDVGEEVKAGQPLMRIDDTDLGLALMARRSAITAAQSAVVQLRADERRYAELLGNGWVPKQRHEQAKAALDTAEAQLAAAEAEARVAENETTYAVLVADADGTVVETLGEPGQVVTAGQIVVRLAQAGPREALVTLPETIRPAIGSAAEASLYGNGGQRSPAYLRELSGSADTATRTYAARYVLDGDAAAAPLGATITLWLATGARQTDVQVPLGAVLDDGAKTGVWIVDSAVSTVHFQPVELVRMTSETAIVSGLNQGDQIVALGAHLLQEGARVRTGSDGN